jgi:hypothetical protein
VCEFAQQLDVLARGERAFLFQPLARDRVERDVAAAHLEGDSVHVSKLAQFCARERRLRGTAPAEHDDFLDPALPQRLERVVGYVASLQLARAPREHARDVRRDVPVADHHRPAGRQIEVELAVVRMSVVPGDELRRGPAAGEVLARDPERFVRLRSGRVDDGVVVLRELAVRDVGAYLHIAEEAGAAGECLAVEPVLQALDLLVIRSDAASQQAPWRRQPLEQVDLGVAPAPDGGRGERARGPRADDRDARSRVSHQAAARSSAAPRPKYSAFSSMAYWCFSGTKASAKIASTGHASTHASQSMHSVGSI